MVMRTLVFALVFSVSTIASARPPSSPATLYARWAPWSAQNRTLRFERKLGAAECSIAAIDKTEPNIRNLRNYVPELSSARRMVGSLTPLLKSLSAIVGKTPSDRSAASEQSLRLQTVRRSYQELDASYNIAMAAIYMGLARQELKGFLVGARLDDAERAATNYVAEGYRWLGKLGRPSANWDLWTTYRREGDRVADEMRRLRQHAAELRIPVYLN
jgi:hypothetical protein